ncbi:MAG: flagellar basal-body rod protein FlgB [Gallionellales bacterium RIFCSPLOWO2_12_FULL_59_22]|nr:MAG: flagellar basal-body rod protein FlgB [Gallionellales bacterium RIFCSPLOWO2_02_FULL_59_110]OGT03949.1 MAG: flagellar basal-body rod protein FlgB [Gallionellales bacterium RIFCSPLOWO2_02_58_13]OGT10607.1 MAG: flagellar basal-body rod protein FlgB [Gallionellales bacterium RIFCSPLOWO2_12_FULL_59_22]
MVDKLDDALRFQQTALSLRAARQELLASNIANADTPNYKARDVDFASALRNAMAGTPTELPVVKSSSLHLEGNSGASLMGSPVMYRKPVQPSADGNTVDMDVERAQFADNAMRYQASIAFINARIKGILSALQG